MDALTLPVHALHLIALALWIGGLIALLVVLPAGRRSNPDDVALLENARVRSYRVMRWALIALVATLALEIVLRAAAQPATPDGFLPALRSLLFGSRYGYASVARWLLLIAALWGVDELSRSAEQTAARATRPGRHALGIVAGGLRRPYIALTRAAWLRIVVILAALLLVSTVIAGPFGDGALPAVVDLLHLSAALVWLGGTIALALVVTPFITLAPPERRGAALLALLDRFSPVAALGAIVLAPTGLWEIRRAAHAPGYLLDTAYGLSLVLKIVVLGAIIVLSLWSALSLRPRLRRLALRARRDERAAARVPAALTALLRVLPLTAALAVAALALTAIGDVYPDVSGAAEARGAGHAANPAPPKGSTAAAPRWQLLGPTTIVYSLVADPANSARLFEGTYTGVYRSLDGGAHWSAASNGLVASARAVNSLTFIPDGSLIAATRDGVYRSTDGAAHWSAAGLQGRAIFTLAAHLAGHVVLLAGGETGDLAGTGAIYRSDDVTRIWQPIFTLRDPRGSAAITSLAWPAIRPRLIVAGTGSPAHSIVVSRDGGTAWREETLGLPRVTSIMSVAVAPGARDVYAGMMGLGAYVRRGVAAWARLNSGLPGLRTGDAHIGSFAFDRMNPGTIYVSTPLGVYRSRDAGLHWAPFGAGLSGQSAYVETVTLVTGPRPALYAATIAGLYRLRLPTPGAPPLAG